MLLSHVRNHYCAISLAPLTALYYYNPGIGAASATAVATATALRELLRKRKPTP